MSEIEGREFQIMLARAFDQAWDSYYGSHRSSHLPEDVARIALAKHIIALGRAGEKDVTVLAESGLMHLDSLSPEPKSWKVSTVWLQAKFLRPWRVRIRR